MAKEFYILLIHLIFHFAWSSTHKLLVLSLDVPVHNVNIEDAYFSDHNQIVFNIFVSNSSLNCKPLGRYACYIKTFNCQWVFIGLLYTWSAVLCNSGSLVSGRGLNVLKSMFNSICNEILDTCAPFKIFGATSNPQPWLNNDTWWSPTSVEKSREAVEERSCEMTGWQVLWLNIRRDLKLQW